MRLTTIIATAALACGLAAAAPSTTKRDDSLVIIGPGSYEDVQEQVNELKSNGTHPNSEKRDGSVTKRICEGVYMCDGSDFTGSCYYACYPISVGIYPDSYWVSRISSVGPDSGGLCDFYGGSDCDDTKYSHQVYAYPGGNLASGIDNNMGCFYCNPYA